MKIMALALALSLPLVGTAASAAPAQKLVGQKEAVKKLEHRIRSLDLTKAEEAGFVAWIKNNKMMIGGLSALVAAGVGTALLDHYCFGDDLWKADGDLCHAPGIATAAVLALLIFDMSRPSDKSCVKSLVQMMLGGKQAQA